MKVTILICSVGFPPLALNFSAVEDTPNSHPAADTAICAAEIISKADEVYAVRVFEGEQVIYEWGGE